MKNLVKARTIVTCLGVGLVALLCSRPAKADMHVLDTNQMQAVRGSSAMQCTLVQDCGTACQNIPGGGGSKKIAGINYTACDKAFLNPWGTCSDDKRLLCGETRVYGVADCIGQYEVNATKSCTSGCSGTTCPN